MKLSRFLTPLLIVWFVGSISPQGPISSILYSIPNIGCKDLLSGGYRTGLANLLAGSPKTFVFEDLSAIADHTTVRTPTDGGIREEIPDKYREKFDKWKAELLSTDYGQRQWDVYANNKQFVLTITISDKAGKGAGTGKYQWDENGQFVGATITLGDELDKGFPGPVYYPVMNSLALDERNYAVNPRILAATKLSHEIGHVDQTAHANGDILRLQDKLMPIYNSIFLKNGLKVNDEKLVGLAAQMGGTPIEIWESREYWSEVEAMAFLKERISKENFYCKVFGKIKQNVEDYARDYRDRFEKSPGFVASPCWN